MLATRPLLSVSSDMTMMIFGEVPSFNLKANSLQQLENQINGCVATFQKRQESDWSSRPGSVSCRHLEQPVEELNLSPNVRTAHPVRCV